MAVTLQSIATLVMNTSGLSLSTKILVHFYYLVRILLSNYLVNNYNTFFSFSLNGTLHFVLELEFVIYL